MVQGGLFRLSITLHDEKTVGRIEGDFRSLALAYFQATQNIVRVVDIGVFAGAHDFGPVRAHRPEGLAAVRETELNITADRSEIVRPQREAGFHRHEVIDIDEQIDLRQSAGL